MKMSWVFEAIDSSAAAEAIRRTNKRFDIYLVLRPDGKVFYVDKGLGRRTFNHEYLAPFSRIDGCISANLMRCSGGPH